jgi:hypothetical protein
MFLEQKLCVWHHYPHSPCALIAHCSLAHSSFRILTPTFLLLNREKEMSKVERVVQRAQRMHETTSTCAPVEDDKHAAGPTVDMQADEPKQMLPRVPLRCTPELVIALVCIGAWLWLFLSS